MLNIELNEEAYPAQLAELTYSISAREIGFMLKVEGFNEKLPVTNHIVFVPNFNTFFLGTN